MAARPKKSIKSPKPVQALSRLRREIQRAQVDRLKASWGSDGKSKIDILLREQRRGNDLLSVLLKQIPEKKSKSETKNLQPVIHRMRSSFFSSDDLFLEMKCLEDAVEDAFRNAGQTDPAQNLETMQAVRKGMMPLMAAIVRETAGVYEKIVKFGQRGFCLFDAKGKVISTNLEMDRFFGTASAVGKPLRSFLDSEGKTLVGRVLKNKSIDTRQLGRMKLIRQNGESKTLGVELAPMAVHAQRPGGYICAVDLTEPVRVETELFENFPWGVARLGLNGEFTYMNPVFLKILGIKGYSGLNVKAILPDAKTRRLVMENLKHRQAGLSNVYPIELCRQSDRKMVPVMIAAMPEKDLHGKIVGSLSIIRDLTVERAEDNIHSYITDSAEARRKVESKKLQPKKVVSGNLMLSDQTTLMMTAAALEVRDLLPYDFFIITRFSESMTHLRKFFFLYPNGQMKSYVRWWEISNPLREGFRKMARTLASAKQVVIEDYEEFLSLPQNRILRDLPEYQWIIEEGFKSSLSHFVVHDKKLLASISLLSKKKMAYGKDHARMLASMPLDKVVMVAIQSEQKCAENFRLELLREIVENCARVDQVAKVVVEGLGKGHLWEHIALYMIDEKEQKFRLLHQRNLGNATPLREPFTQPLRAGVLGYVYRTRKHVLIQDKPGDKNFRDIYLGSVPGMMSEFCMPIVIDEKVRWLLNLEDSNKNAFSIEEIKDLTSLMDEVSRFLDRIWARHFLSTTLDNSSDIVFMTNAQGYIEDPNIEAHRQLAYTKKEMARIKLRDIIVEQDAAEIIINSPVICKMEVTLRRKNGSSFPVLLSASTLPKEFGGKVMTCTDRSLYKRVEELEYLGKMYHEIAVQTQTPLSLAFGWIESLKIQNAGQTARDTLDKVQRQLKKIEITYNRLALYNQVEGVIPYNEVLFSMSEIAAHIKSTFPLPEAEKIVFQLTEPLPNLKGDLFQLNFCFDSILSFLLRHLPPEETIKVNVSCVEDDVIAQIRGFLPRPSAEHQQMNQLTTGVAKTLAQMALSREVIEQFVSNNSGTLTSRLGKGYEQLFEIRLPVAREG